MNGFVAKALAGLCAAGALGAAGCVEVSYRDWVDPCYPERYEHAARVETNAVMAPQLENGHVLDQTVWNTDFEAGTERLTPGGLEHLKYLARRRPHADPVVWVQLAQDVAYDPAAAERYTQRRFELTNRRVQAVQGFLAAYTAGTGEEFQVRVNDPGEVGQSAAGVGRSVLLMHASYQGALPGVVVVPGGPGAR
jgi:hypothetical protein